MKQLRTKYRIERDRTDMAIYRERKRMMKKKGAMASVVDKIIMEKYGYHSRASIWLACKRGEKKSQEEGK